MKKLIKVITLFCCISSIFSCKKDSDSPYNLTQKAYSEQNPSEIIDIEKFFTDYSMSIDSNKDIFFKKIEIGDTDTKNIKEEYKDKLDFKIINYDGYDFKVYYINLNEKKLEDGGKLEADYEKSPCPLDSVFVKYKGMLLKEKTDYNKALSFEKNQTFDEAKNAIWMRLNTVIPGWYNMLSYMTPGNKTINTNTNTVDFENYTSAVIFLPSGLAYYSRGTDLIPQYSPLIFNIKLLSIKNIDPDNDKIITKKEQFEFNSASNYPWQYVKRDTDLDGILDSFDADDDNDGILTKNEFFGDTDNDGKKDYLDTDDDNDGVLTRNEYDGDDNNNGIPNYRDPLSKRSK